MSEAQQGGNSNLQKQDLALLDVTKLHPLSPEVISRQATVNLGTIGHVAHGKSTIVKAISGVHTVRFKNELERNITIKLGFVDGYTSTYYGGTDVTIAEIHEIDSTKRELVPTNNLELFCND